MLDYYKIIDKIATTPYEMFNGAANGLTVEHFKMVAANGLFQAMEVNAASNSNFKNLYYIVPPKIQTTCLIKFYNLNL